MKTKKVPQKKFWRHKNGGLGEEEWERKPLKKRWIIVIFMTSHWATFFVFPKIPVLLEHYPIPNQSPHSPLNQSPHSPLNRKTVYFRCSIKVTDYSANSSLSNFWHVLNIILVRRWTLCYSYTKVIGCVCLYIFYGMKMDPHKEIKSSQKISLDFFL